MAMKKVPSWVLWPVFILVLGGFGWLWLRKPPDRPDRAKNREGVETIRPTGRSEGNRTEKAAGTVSPVASQVPTIGPQKILREVPFTSQAPLAEWDDPRQQDGCEEASALMAVAWARGEKLGSKETARAKMLEISDWQNANFGPGHDTSAADTVARIFRGYFGFEGAWAAAVGQAEEITAQLQAGRLVVTPMNGQLLGNPYYTQPGPERHMVVIRGWDPKKNEFITNDPGTRRGEGYRYDERVFWNAIRDYPTGDHLPIEGVKKVMIVVSQR